MAMEPKYFCQGGDGSSRQYIIPPSGSNTKFSPQLSQETVEPRKKSGRILSIESWWKIGILILRFMKYSPHIPFHPLYTLNSQGPFFPFKLGTQKKWSTMTGHRFVWRNLKRCIPLLSCTCRQGYRGPPNHFPCEGLVHPISLSTCAWKSLSSTNFR